MSLTTKTFFRTALIIFYGYILYKYFQSRDFYWFMDFFNLLIHEGGHLFFNFFGVLIGMMGGTLFQLIIPAVTIPIFLNQKDYFAISFSLFWLGTNMFNIARYVADAQLMRLPLVHMGSGEPIHDWNYILSHFGILAKTAALSDFMYALGYLLLIIGLIFGLYHIVKPYLKSV